MMNAPVWGCNLAGNTAHENYVTGFLLLHAIGDN